MNVLHIDEQTGWRGGEQQASYLIRGLAERGHFVALAGRPGSPFLQADHGAPDAPRIAAPFKGEADILTAYRLSRAIKRHNIDIIHAHTSHAHTLACIARRIAGRGKVVVSRRVDFVPKSTAINRWKYSLPDHYIAISGRIAEVLREFGIPAEKVSLVHSGIDPARVNVPPLDRKEFSVPDNVFLLGNVAALVGHKDQETLLRAFAIVLAKQPNSFLVIAGDGDLRLELETLTRQLNIHHSVRFLGYFKDAPRLLRTLDAFVMSSKEEGLGTSILDAMAAGIPVIATAAGGIPEAVHHQKTGLLSPPQDAEALAQNILRAMSERDLAQQLTENAKQLVEKNFTAQAMVNGNIAVYQRLQSKSRPERPEYDSPGQRPGKQQ